MKEIAATLDQLSTDMQQAARSTAIGATEAHLLNALARIFASRSAALREGIAVEEVEHRRREAEAIAADRTERAVAGLAAGGDPAEFEEYHVRAYLAQAGVADALRVLDLERAGKNRTPIVTRGDGFLAAAQEREDKTPVGGKA